jgi:hypothetical protein
MKKWMMSFAIGCGLIVAGCGNPGGATDSEYAQYKERGAPKILYSCAVPLPYLKKVSLTCPNISAMSEPDRLACVEKATKKYSDPNEKFPMVGMISGTGMNATYNFILSKAKQDCEGDFKILESQQ